MSERSLYNLHRILAEGPDALTLVYRKAESYSDHRPGVDIVRFVFELAAGGYLEAVFRPPSRTLSLSYARDLLDFNLSGEINLRSPAKTIGTIDVPLDDVAADISKAEGVPAIDGWLADDGQHAHLFIAALEDAIGQKAQARCYAMVALGKAIAMREGIETGALRPFLASGPRFKIYRSPSQPSRSRLVGVFRARVKTPDAPPCLHRFAGKVRFFEPTQPSLTDLRHITIRISPEESRHERLAWRTRAIEAFAADGYDITPWLFA